MHNYVEDNIIGNEKFDYYIKKAPVFYKTDADKLRDFIKEYIKKGDNGNALYEIKNGRIRPSKYLADTLVSMFKDLKKEFTLIDEQEVVFQKGLFLNNKSKIENSKNILIVEGGPGTGKSVVAMNLLVELIKRSNNTRYVTKNSAIRSVLEAKLTGIFTKTRINNLFSSSGKFIESESNDFDALIVDEAHRLNSKSGIYGNLGEDQTKEIMKAAKCSIFFIDNNQQVTTKDVGTKEYIKNTAKDLNIKVYEMSLPSQFRCNGSDGYLS